jgi:hypothetical protein
VTSALADAVIDKARECYRLGLIDERKLERVTRLALAEPDYATSGVIIDLPFDWHIAEARRLERRRARQNRHGRLRRLLGRLL